MNVDVDRDRRFGSGGCELISPRAFVVGAEGVAEGLPSAAEEDPETLKLARGSCPSEAISLEPPP